MCVKNSYLCSSKNFGTMNRNIQELIPSIKQYFKTQPITRAWLFGSYSRGEETPDSDVDILVQYTDSDRISLFTISRIASALRKIVGRRVDLVEEGCLLPFAEVSANRDKVLIYEREN